MAVVHFGFVCGEGQTRALACPKTEELAHSVCEQTSHGEQKVIAGKSSHSIKHCKAKNTPLHLKKSLETAAKSRWLGLTIAHHTDRNTKFL